MWRSLSLSTHLCDYNPGTNQIAPPYWTWIIADRALISPCNGTLSIIGAMQPLSPGCLLKLNEEIQELLTFRSTAPLIVKGMFCFNFINQQKVKANLPYEKQLRRRWLELFSWEKGLPLIVCECSRVHTVYCMKSSDEPNTDCTMGNDLTSRSVWGRLKISSWLITWCSFS